MMDHEINSLQSQFNFSRTAFIRCSPQDDIISLNKLIEQCSKHSITLIQLADKRLESGLNILPLKAKLKDRKETIVLFLTKFSQKIVTVTAFYDGKRIQKTTANNETEIVRLIRKWLDSIKSTKQNYQSQSLKLIQKLDKKCIQIAKQQKNQMMAIQKLKSTRQYQSLIEQQIQLSMEIQSISQTLIQTEKQVQKGNYGLIDKILQIEFIKNQIEQNQYEYEEACKCFRNVKDLINQMLERQQEKVSSMDITSENKLVQFITEAKKLKKLELQQKFIH